MLRNLHKGNIIPDVTLEEHDGEIYAKRVSLVSAATIFAQENTAAAGQASVVLDTGANWIGLASVSGALTFSGSVTVGNLVSASTIFAVVNTAAAGQASVVLDTGSRWVGLVSVANPLPVNATGQAGANYIGLASVNIGGTLPALAAGANYIGLASVNLGGSLPAGVAFIGFATIRIAANDGVDIGNVDVASLSGNVTLSDARTYIGLTSTTLGVGTSFIGLATTVPDFGSNVTIHTGIYSATGNNTVFVAPASNRFWLTNLHVASLGRAEVEILSGATTLIPFTALATTGGYLHNFNPPGLPSRAQADALVVNLNGAATISVMAAWYARP